MIFTKDMINLRIYKRPVFLPTLENDTKANKKTKSLIYLLTPDRATSINLMNHPMTINRTRYQSYYIEKDLTHFVNNRILSADNLDESAYILEETNNVDNLVFSGYEKDINVIKQFIDPGIYHAMVNDLGCYEVAPTLNIIVGDFPERDNYFSMRFNNIDGVEYIYVDIPRATSTIATEEYAKRVLNFIFKALVINKFRDTVMTTIPAIVADSFSGADTIEGDYGRYLFFGDHESDVVIVPNITKFWEYIAAGNYASIVEELRRKYPDITIRDLAFENSTTCAVEASTPITMENLGKKFKYATTSKFKRQFSTKINSIKRALNKISSSYSMAGGLNIPTVGSPNIGGGVSTEVALDGLTENEDYFILGENVVLFVEDAKYDLKLKELLYRDRIRSSKEILAINRQIKKDCPIIKYAFPNINAYKQKNLFVDLYFYNQVFFKNNTWQQKRGFDLYLDLLNRLINDNRFVKEGYEKKTIFIPINEWNTNNTSRMWLYRENINPVSIIYELMIKNPAKVKQVFKDTDILFFGKSSIFKMNFSEFKDNSEIKKQANKFRTFIVKIISNEAFDPVDLDVDTNSKNTPEAIKADLYDRFEISQGIDLTGKEKIEQKNIDNVVNTATSKYQKQNFKDASTTTQLDRTSTKDKVEKEEIPDTISKGVDKEKKEEVDEDLAALAAKFAKYANEMPDPDSAIDAMEDDATIKNILRQIDASENPGIKISTTRAARINNLSDNLLDKKIENRSIKDILNKNQSENKIDKTQLEISTPNDEWKNLTYMNFDKKYDMDADIVSCFNHFTTVSLPLAIRDIAVTDNSTSEDRTKLYTVKFEDFTGKRHTVRLDIPVPIDNRFLLRGNSKVIATQFLNMPILKTDLDTAQIITNYQKIYIRRYNEANGRSIPVTSMFIKAIQKYEGNTLKITFGDNSRICNKYELPIDYIDISSSVNSIEIPSKNVKIYFNQDEIREEYGDYIKENMGVPYLVNTKSKAIFYYDGMQESLFTSDLISRIAYYDNNFLSLIDSQRASSSGTYTRCKILGTLIPMVVVVGYVDGLEKVLQKAGITYEWKERPSQDDRNDTLVDWIKFNDGYLVYRTTYSSTLLLNGLKDCPTDMYSMADVNDKKMYIEFLDNFGGRIKADGIDNFNDCLIDPITKEVMEYYGLPTEFVTVLLYANNLLADNKFIKHTDTSSRRIRRAEMVAAYTYEALSESYGYWANQVRHGKRDAEFKIKQSIVIDKLMQSPISQDDSINNALGAVEETNNITFKGKAGLNKDRAYSLDKRTFDDSMLNVLGASTAFSANVGIGRASTINMNVDNVRGYIKQIDSDTTKMNTANSLTATEAMIPFEVNRDDNTRVSMSFIQTAKHQVRTNKGDPLLVTSGIDEVLPYTTTDTFAFKAKEDGSIIEYIPDEYIILQYKSGQKDYISLKEEIKKNSDGGYYIPIKLDIAEKLKVGSKIKEGQIIAYDPKSFTNSLGESDNIAYEAGDLVKVAIINSDEGFEDSGLCIERLAKELTTQVIYKFEHVIEKDAIIYSSKKIGDYVNVGDPLLIWQDSFEDEDVNAVLRVMGKDTVEDSELGRKTIKSETTGTVAGIKIYRTCELDEMSESVRKIVKEYEAPIKALKKKLDSEGIPSSTLPATYALPSVGKLKRADDALYIEYYVQHDDIVGVGDKIVFFAANKAIIRQVVPDELAPYTDFRPNEPISAFVSVVSINKRMVTSTLVNGAINKIMVEMARKAKDMAGIPYDDTQI